MTEQDKSLVLCIDDNEDTCEMISVLLGFAGYEVISRHTSQEGLAMARQGGLAAIILDFQLPDMFGIELCREIRAFDSCTPIVFFSALNCSLKRAEALDAGAQAYLVKPNDIDRLKEVIGQLVRANSQEASVLVNRAHGINRPAWAV